MSDPLPNVERANRLLTAAWKAGILTEPDIDARALEAIALGGRDRSAFGSDDGWREPFERLVVALREEADLNPLGKTMAYSQIVHLLRARMRASRPFSEAILDQLPAMPAPIIIVGQMRSGTTRLQRLLACDRRLAHTRTFETLTPVPWPARRLRARAILAAVSVLNPLVLRIHPAAPRTADEEFGWLAFGFGPAQFEAQWRVPSFSRWWEKADTTPLYRDFDRLVRLNRLSRRESTTKPHVFKVPQFCEDLPTLLKLYPEAKFIVLGRDADKIVGSSASLVWNHMRIQSESIDKKWVGQEWLRKTRLRQELLESFLRNHPDIPVVRVDYEAMNRDWLAEMKRIYAFLGLDLTPTLIRRMDGWLGSSHSHMGHRYSLEEFGIGAQAANTKEMALAG